MNKHEYIVSFHIYFLILNENIRLLVLAKCTRINLLWVNLFEIKQFERSFL